MCSAGIREAIRRFGPGKERADVAFGVESGVARTVTARGWRQRPPISAFYGVVIAMYFSDHPPPHFHARYAEYEATVDIATGTLLSGALPPRAQRMVQDGPACTGPSSNPIGKGPLQKSH